MINPIEQLDFLEKQSKSSLGILMVLGYIMLGGGLLFCYASTVDITIKNEAIFVIGSVIVVLAILFLYVVYKEKYAQEILSKHQELRSATTQMLKDDLDLYIKLIEYNEKAIEYNEKHKDPKMDILTYGDLCNWIEQHFDARSSLFKKS